LIAAGFHVYVSAPDAFKVIELPEQITGIFTEAVNTGRVFTVTVTAEMFVLVHPVSVLVPLTE
jgi:hypothetical protein